MTWPCIFFFQAEDGIRDRNVTEFRRVLFRSMTKLPLAGMGTGTAGVTAAALTSGTTSSTRGAGGCVPRRAAAQEIGRASCRESGGGKAAGGETWSMQSHATLILARARPSGDG